MPKEGRQAEQSVLNVLRLQPEEGSRVGTGGQAERVALQLSKEAQEPTEERKRDRTLGCLPWPQLLV